MEFQPKFGIQLGTPISMGLNLGECSGFMGYGDLWGFGASLKIDQRKSEKNPTRENPDHAPQMFKSRPLS